MVRKITLHQEDAGVAFALPREIAERLQLHAGDEVFMVETAGGVLLTRADPESAEALDLYEEGARRYREAVRELGEVSRCA